jgi:hypothetical protein
MGGWDVSVRDIALVSERSGSIARDCECARRRMIVK